MVKVRGDNVQALREHQSLSERQTAIRVAARLNENPGTWRHAIRRIERRELSELGADEAAALAEELGVDVESLGEELLWTWQTDEGYPWSVGTKALAFTDPGAAFDRRDWLAHVSQGKYPTKSIRVVPRLRDDLLAELGRNINDSTKRLAAAMLLVDPTEDELQAITALELLLQDGKETDSDLLLKIDVIVNLGLATTITARYVAKLEEVYRPESEEFKRELKRLAVLHRLAQKVLDRVGAAIVEADAEPPRPTRQSRSS
jgi:hypothetical protein